MKLKTWGTIFVLSSLSLFAQETLSDSSVRSATAGSCLKRTNPAPAPAPEPCQAPMRKEPPKRCCDLEAQRFQLGGTYAYNWITPQGNPTTSGNLGGVQAIYEYRPLGSVYAGAMFNWRAGKTTNHDS